MYTYLLSDGLVYKNADYVDDSVSLRSLKEREADVSGNPRLGAAAMRTRAPD